MKAIQTKYHGPTDTKKSKIIARAEGVPALFVSYDYALDIDDNHKAAAKLLAQKYNWTHELISGVLPDRSMSHVFVPKIVTETLARLQAGDRSGGVMGDASLALDELKGVK